MTETELTQQEIEKEREEFERFIIYFYSKTPFCFSEKAIKRSERDSNKYHFTTIQLSFEIWLARAELAKGDK